MKDDFPEPWNPDGLDCVERHQRQVAQRRAHAARTGARLSVLDAAGIIAARAPVFGDSRSALLHQIACEQAHAAQRFQFCVQVRCSVTLPNSKVLGPGDEVTLDLLTPGPDVADGVTPYTILGELRRLGVISTIDEKTAFVRQLPPDVEYVAYVELRGKGGKVIPAGTAVTEADFDPPPQPRKPTVAEEAAQIVLRQLGRPSGSPAPVSIWDAYLANDSIVRNPSYKPRRSRS